MMAAFLSRRIRRWALLAIGIPLAAKFADAVADELEQRRGGEDLLTKSLHSSGSYLRGKSKGPAARQSRQREPAEG